MNHTVNLALRLPEVLESANIEDINNNFVELDEYIADQKQSNAETFLLHQITMGVTRKNVLQNKASNKVANGISFTVHADGSVTATGTATAAAYLTLSSAFAVPRSGRYILTGCPAGGSSSKYQLYLSGGVTAYDRGAGATVHITSDSSVSAYIMVASGQTVDLTFYPMLRPEEITDGTYDPYKPSIEERLAALEAALPAQAMEVIG